jgi:hypothetical protein
MGDISWRKFASRIHWATISELIGPVGVLALRSVDACHLLIFDPCCWAERRINIHFLQVESCRLLCSLFNDPNAHCSRILLWSFCQGLECWKEWRIRNLYPKVPWDKSQLSNHSINDQRSSRFLRTLAPPGNRDQGHRPRGAIRYHSPDKHLQCDIGWVLCLQHGPRRIASHVRQDHLQDRAIRDPILEHGSLSSLASTKHVIRLRKSSI